MGEFSDIPREGVYVSKTDPTLRISVVEVNFSEDDDEPDDELFYLVSWVEEGNEDDMSAPAYELNPTEWEAFVNSEQLEFAYDPYLLAIPEDSHLTKLLDVITSDKKNDRS
ncbi:UNVERIFIED_ORG: hypothetical protein M2414_000018 [Rahnella aquatilis]